MLAVFALLATLSHVSAAPFRLRLVSVNSTGTQANEVSSTPDISADGRFAAFYSFATNLDPRGPQAPNINAQIYVRDLALGTTEWVSLDLPGPSAGHVCADPSISGDGRFVAFFANERDPATSQFLKPAGVWVRDRLLGTTQLVSVTSSGVPANGSSGAPEISDDGRYVVFTSGATNLLPVEQAAGSVYVRDLELQTTELISGAPNAGVVGDAPSISADGRYVVFGSWSNALVPNDTNISHDLFIFDRHSQTTERVNFNLNGQQRSDHCIAPSLSPDGRFVAYIATESVLSLNPRKTDVFLYDRLTRATECVSVDLTGNPSNWPHTSVHDEPPRISDGGRYVVFVSEASSLVANDLYTNRELFLRDRALKVTRRVLVTTAGTQPIDGSNQPSLSSDGARVVFYTNAADILPGVTAGANIVLAELIPNTSNRAPVADPGPDQQFTLPHDGSPASPFVNVTFDGSRSSDPDGDGLTHQWRDPAGTLVATSATFTRSLGAGKHTFRLRVTDVNDAYGEASVTVHVLPEPNRLPLANAGPGQQLAPGHDGDPATNTVSVTLNGGRSSDPDGDTLAYRWEDSSGAIVGSAAQLVRSVPVGKHTFRLRVTDPYGADDEESVSVHVLPEPNRAPVANAGPGQAVTVPSDGNPNTDTIAVTLNGGSSFDPDGDSLTYAWRGPEGAVLGDTPLHTLQLSPGKHTFRLTVTDSYGAADVEAVQVLVLREGNRPPVARAGADQEVRVPHDTTPGAGTASVQLNGSRSTDPDGDPLTYEWRSGANVLVGTTAAVSLSLEPGTHTFFLRVADSYGAESEDRVLIRVRPALNRRPVARAGADITIEEVPDALTPVTLNGSASSDPDGDSLTYHWSLLGTPVGESASLAINLEPGRHRLRLTVTDPYGASAGDEMIVNVGVVDVTGDVVIRKGRLTAGKRRGEYSVVVRITNRTADTLPAPLSLALDGLPATVKVTNASGVTNERTGRAGSPYLDAPGSLAPGQTIALTVRLTLRGRAQGLPGTQRVLAGAGLR